MADSGLIRFLQNGIRFATSKAATVYVGLRLLSDPATSLYLNLPTALPNSVQALTVDPAGNMAYQPLQSGTVTSVGLALPPIFNVTGSPVTTSGTLTAAFNNQAQNLVFASPDGSNGTPAFRALVAADIPTLTAAKISDFDTQARTSRLDQMAAPTAAVSFNSQPITGLADPTNAQDAATKAYVDAVAQGLDVKSSVRVASTANVSLAAPGAAIDGVTLANGDRVLIKDQSSASQNGIFVFNGSGSAMTRASDANTSPKVTSGMFTFVEEGTANADSGWILTTDGPITLNTTSLSFTQFSGAGQIAAGAGLVKTGNTLDAVGTANRIVVNPDSIDIASTYAGQTSITTLGTIATGTWQGTAIALAYGGTGANTAAGARSNLGAAGVVRFSFTNANLVAGLITLTHNLSQYVSVQVFDNSNKQILPDEITLTNATQCQIDVSSFGTITGTWNVVVVG